MTPKQNKTKQKQPQTVQENATHSWLRGKKGITRVAVLVGECSTPADTCPLILRRELLCTEYIGVIPNLPCKRNASWEMHDHVSDVPAQTWKPVARVADRMIHYCQG